MANVDFEDGVMTVNVELEKDDSNIWDKMNQETTSKTVKPQRK